MTKETKTKLAETKGNLPEISGLQTSDLMEMQGMGLENVESSDVVFPFINIIQSGSPQRKKGKEGYIEGAEEGMLYNTSTKEIFDGNKGLTLVPIYHEKRLIERTSKTAEKAPKFVADHKQDKSVLQGLKKSNMWEYVTKDGNSITPTDYIYFLILKEAGETEFAVISFKSTLAKQARDIVSQSKFRSILLPNGKKWSPPLFFKSYKFKTAMKSNDDNDWHVYSVSPADDLVKFDKEGNLVDNIPGGAAVFEESFRLCKDIFKEGVHVVDSAQDTADSTASQDGDAF